MEDDSEIEIFALEGSQGNVWTRVKLEITNSTKLETFRVVFKATIGERYMGDIALDDIVFDPNCRWDFYKLFPSDIILDKRTFILDLGVHMMSLVVQVEHV